MATYGDTQRIYREVEGLAALHGYTLAFALEFNRRALALDAALASQQGVDWKAEPPGMLLAVAADTPLGDHAQALFDQLITWLAGQGMALRQISALQSR